MNKDKLINLRKKLNVTQEKIAKEIGIGRSGYNAFELGRNECDHATLRKLADYFDVTVDYLLDRTNEQKIEKDSTMQSITYKEKALLEEYRKCDDFGKAQSFGYVKALAKGTEQNFNDITKLQNRDED